MVHKIGIYGGSFNPLHYAHMKTGEFLVRNRYVDEILYMVNPCSPFKMGQHIPDVYFRIQATEIALKAFYNEEHPSDVGYRKLWASNYEATQFFGQPVCYTVDTLRRFLYTSVFDDEEIYFILGVDTFNDIKKFKDWEWFLETKLVKFLVLPRKGYALHSNMYSEFKDITTYVDPAPYMEMSSTEVRELFKKGEYEKLKEYMPQEEIDYVKDKKLYI